MSDTFNTVIYRGTPEAPDAENEIPVCVYYTAHPACRGARDSLGGVRGAGPALEPDEPASVEVEQVASDGLRDIELTDAERERIEEEIASGLDMSDIDPPDRDDD